MNGISVIIPNFNYAQWIKRCVESCLGQGSLLHEVVIVDDNSTDNSVEIIEELIHLHPGKVKMFINPQKGGNHARNYGLEQSSGEYIQWLDADDQLLPGKFAAQIVPLQRGEADIIYSDWRLDNYKNGELKQSRDVKYGPFDDFLFELIRDNWTVPCNYLLRRSVAKKLAGGVGWNPETKVAQDREYFTMAGIMGARFKYVPGCYAVYNKQFSGTVSGMDFNQRLELNQLLEARFREEIQKQDWIAKGRKKRYLYVLDTHKLKACFYHHKIGLNRPISPFYIQWHLIHWKMRLIMPWVYLRSHIRYFLGYSSLPPRS